MNLKIFWQIFYKSFINKNEQNEILGVSLNFKGLSIKNNYCI